MASWKYITVIVLILIGGTLLFGCWSINQFNLALSNFDASYNQLGAGFIARNKPSLSEEIVSTTNISQDATEIPDISIIFPSKNDEVYIGCNYKISWQSSATIKSLDIALVDAGTQKPTGPIASGLPATSTQTKFENLNWKVGNVWPGDYYILVSNINGQDIHKKSKVFTVNKLPEGENQDSFCISQ